MSIADRLAIIVPAAPRRLPSNAGQRLCALTTPIALATTVGVTAIWAASHFVGVGEMADVVLLVAGYLGIDGEFLNGAKKLFAFALATHSARTQAEERLSVAG